MASIPESYHELFEKETVAHFATLTPEGFPHVTPVWIDYDPEADRVLVNTARGRRKERNVRADPRVGVSMVDPDDAYRYCSVVGEVTALTEAGAEDHIDELAARYFGVDEYPSYDEDPGPRVIVEIRPDEVFTA
ncbi:pyridoxamine 5'-phosphate oxidase family protein [Halosimplex pelagicum]|uniref:PPOX class F420-dependent oxidoreductase n=1 Tax=Halosimplex pelagicum TaxID=869886 RepID=A0A7D5P957_9EURY|nr:PPOX class F420-dependent oxidoreductase [Halosimplex pelagicum]QLH81884.1 PPOX class F420-dependent oxidoreductase [Halosimplex pelagicum]